MEGLTREAYQPANCTSIPDADIKQIRVDEQAIFLHQSEGNSDSLGGD